MFTLSLFMKYSKKIRITSLEVLNTTLSVPNPSSGAHLIPYLTQNEVQLQPTKDKNFIFRE